MREACAQGNQILPKIAGYMDITIYFGGLKISANSCIIILINIKSFIIFPTPINVTPFLIVLIVCNYRLLLFICITNVYFKKKKKKKKTFAPRAHWSGGKKREQEPIARLKEPRFFSQGNLKNQVHTQSKTLNSLNLDQGMIGVKSYCSLFWL